jgi:Raf kinase inhibitor-like YbhB/YbcL family protein
MTWTAPPAGTVELALVVTDDDAGGFVHWAVAGIAPTAGETGEGATITGALEGVNDAGTVGWTGPCPPPGAPHTYRFTMYALAQQAELPDGFTGADLVAVAEPASTAIAELTGTYTRAG